MSRIFIILSVLILTSCTDSVDIQLEPEVQLFLSTDTKESILLTEKDEGYSALNTWLHEHQSNWHSTSGRFPDGVFIRSGNHGIQVTLNHVILYSMNTADPKAIYIQKIGKKDLSEIKSIGN